MFFNNPPVQWRIKKTNMETIGETCDPRKGNPNASDEQSTPSE